jgi:hypothetical protein
MFSPVPSAKNEKRSGDMKANLITGETDLRLFAEETADTRPLTMSELRAAVAEIPGKVQEAIRRERATRAFTAAIREQDGDRLKLRF